MSNKPKTNEEWIDELAKQYKIDIHGKSYVGYTDDKNKVVDVVRWHPFADTLLKALQAKDLENKEREEELKADIRHLMGVGDEFPLIKKNGRYLRPHKHYHFNLK